jgi:hypothetical protein
MIMKKYLLIVGFIFSSQLFAQTGIGTASPNASAKLDVYATNKGFLPPRVTLTSATDASTIASPAEGLLVYNVGSVGLQAGYYYWNGANWATIATATSAGNGVAASDMVKLYGEAHSSAAGKISSATGYVFTVPVSGRYLFDFTSSATALGGGTNTIYFQVRQGTTVLGSDMQSSYNNNVHVEYNGKVEVNLQAGVSYNIYNYATSGSFEANDYDRVYYKMVAGNLPVTGQSVDYVSVSRTGSDLTVNSGDVIIYNTKNSGNIPYNTSTGFFSLTAGKTYKLIASVSLSNGNTAAKEVNFIWKNAAGEELGAKGELLSPSANVTASGSGVAYAVYTPFINTTVALYVNYSSTNTILWQNYSFASIEQIGSSAIINPWVLSGSDVYNNTGEVGIGNTTPNAKLDVRTSPTSTSDPGAGTIGLGTSSATAASSGIGALRYNINTNRVEVSNGSVWKGPAGSIYAQFQANAQQSFYAAGGKVSFPNTIINNGGITITGNNTITLPAGRIYRIDFNMGWTSMAGGWARFVIYNAGTSTAISTAAHLEAVTNNGGYAGSGATTTFVDATSGSVQIDVRYTNPANYYTYLGDTGSGTSYPYIVIQAVD